MSPSYNFEKWSWRHTITKLFLSLSAHNDSAMVKINDSKKTLSQRFNTVNYSASADTLRVAVHMERIVRAKDTCLLPSFKCLVNYSFQDGQREGVKSSKQLDLLYFKNNNLCLILTFFCSTGHKITLNYKGLQETGTKLDTLKLSTKCASWGKILIKKLHGVTWIMYSLSITNLFI